MNGQDARIHFDAPSTRSEIEMRMLSEEERALVALLPRSLRQAGATLIGTYTQTVADMADIMQAHESNISQALELKDYQAKIAAFRAVYRHDFDTVWPLQAECKERRHNATLAFLKVRQPYHPDQHDGLVSAVTTYIRRDRSITLTYQQSVGEGFDRWLGPGAFANAEQAYINWAADNYIISRNCQIASVVAATSYSQARDEVSRDDPFLTAFGLRI
jgi:hypothetical protein